jgi:hypothetical protein
VYVGARFKPTIPLNQFAAHNMDLFAGSVVLVTVWPFATRCNIDNPTPHTSSAREVPSIATGAHFDQVAK